MSIVFYCSQCGSRFEVGDDAAGKPGRCRRCGEKITVPTQSRPSPQPADESRGPAWLQNMGTNVALAPITIDRMPGVGKRRPGAPPIDEDLGDSKPYGLVDSWTVPVVEAAGRDAGPAGKARVAWRTSLTSIQRLFRGINEFAYLLSVPFLMLLLIGASLQNRGLALLGAEAVVLLNIGRIVTGLAALLAVPFREGPVVGLLFLVPPFTIKYMIDHWNKFKRPARRVATPLLTIAAVGLAFVFLPSLSGGPRGKIRPATASANAGR